MKKVIYKLFGKFGYRVDNRRKRTSEIEQEMKRFGVIKNLSLLMRANRYVSDLGERYEDLEIKDSGKGVIVSFDNTSFFIESPEEFFILSEVFLEKDYNFIANESSLLVDIGANIGISSIYFMKNNNLKKIIAFEPVLDTFQQALENIRRNSFEEKVTLHNFGLGINNRSETFIFNKDIKGNTGVRGKLSQSYSNQKNIEERDVEIKDASEVFSKIIADNANERIVVKMDCEGAEYEIIESLSKSKLLEKIDVWMIEWHDKGPQFIESELQKAGYFIFSRQLAVNSGMIYAVKAK